MAGGHYSTHRITPHPSHGADPQTFQPTPDQNPLHPTAHCLPLTQAKSAAAAGAKKPQAAAGSGAAIGGASGIHLLSDNDLFKASAPKPRPLVQQHKVRYRYCGSCKAKACVHVCVCTLAHALTPSAQHTFCCSSPSTTLQPHTCSPHTYPPNSIPTAALFSNSATQQHHGVQRLDSAEASKLLAASTGHAPPDSSSGKQAAAAAAAAADQQQQGLEEQKERLSLELAVREDGSGVDLNLRVIPASPPPPAAAAAAPASKGPKGPLARGFGSSSSTAAASAAGGGGGSGVTRIGAVSRIGGGAASAAARLLAAAGPPLSSAAARAQRAAASVQVPEGEEGWGRHKAATTKQVSWQADTRLVSVRWFKKEDSPQQVRSGGRMCLGGNFDAGFSGWQGVKGCC